MIRADLHDGKLLVHASVLTLGLSAVLILPDFSVATSRDLLVLKGHELRVLHVRVDHGTILVSEGLSFSIRVPIIVILNVSLVFVEGVIQVTINPGDLRDNTKVEGQLNELTTGIVFVVLAQLVDFLESAGVY